MESVQISALTELDAVNNIIGTIGEAPINSLEDMTDVDAINALRILQDINRQEQARGWSFNKVPRFTLTPNEEGKILWNDQYLYIKAHPHCHWLHQMPCKLVRQGDYIKNLYSDKITWDEPIDVEMVMLVPFEHLPEQMRTYILAKACFVFQSRYFGDEGLYKVTQQQVQEAWQYLQEFEIDNNNYSMFDSTHVAMLRRR